MSPINIAIPLHGKMTFRSLHSLHLMRSFGEKGLFPIYYIDRNIIPEGSSQYEELNIDKYSEIINKDLVQFTNYLRWFLVNTPSTESRLKNIISDSVWSTNNIEATLTKAIWLNRLRKLQFLAPLLVNMENLITSTNAHKDSFREREIKGALVSGVGNHDFEVGAFFAREALKQKIPVVANITNYDNLLSKGYKGFSPDKLTVWSRKMALQAEKLMDIPRKNIVTTGPVVFDRYFKPLSKERASFLQERGLDPTKKTVFYAGHTSVVTYFDFLSILVHLRHSGNILANCNLIIRPYPHPKVNKWAGIRFFREAVSSMPNVYISDPFQQSSDTFVAVTGEALDTSTDELHGILKYSDVMINYFSTLGLEAAICDLPTIHIGYDPFTYQISPMAWSSTGAKNAHNQDKLRLAASSVVHSDKQLEESLENYLNNKKLHQQERLDYALSECTFLDGKAAQRLAEVVSSLLK